jgi:hypothetical protein
MLVIHSAKQKCSLEKDLEERRLHLLDLIDEGGFQKLVVFNGWIGFFAGAYQVSSQAWLGILLSR